MREADRKSLRRCRDGLEGIDQRLAKACKEVLIDVTIKRQDKTLLPGCLAFTEIDVDAVKNYDTASKLLRQIAFARSEERRVGKSVSVGVDLGGRRIIKKQNEQEEPYKT